VEKIQVGKKKCKVSGFAGWCYVWGFFSPQFSMYSYIAIQVNEQVLPLSKKTQFWECTCLQNRER